MPCATPVALSRGVVCVCVCVIKRYHFKEGKGRLQSWTPCDRLSEGVMGQGLATPTPPSPCPLASQRDGRTGSPRSGVFPLCPPMASARVPRAPCGHRIRVQHLRGHPHRRPPPPTPGRGGAGRAYASHPEQRALSQPPPGGRQPRVSLMVPGAAMPHPPAPEARLAGGALCASHRDCMGCRGPTLRNPGRCAGRGRGAGGSLLADTRGASPARPSVLVPASGAASLAGAADGAVGVRMRAVGPVLPLPLCTLPLLCSTEGGRGGPGNPSNPELRRLSAFTGCPLDPKMGMCSPPPKAGCAALTALSRWAGHVALRLWASARHHQSQ